MIETEYDKIGTDRITLKSIKADLKQAEARAVSVKSSTEVQPANKSNELFIIKPANEWIELAKNTPVPRMLFGQLWFENELCILFADTNLGKSILAVQIGNSISKGEAVKGFALEAGKQPVLYFDFELSRKQFEGRYSDNYTNHYRFDPNFLRSEINPDSEIPAETDFEAYLGRKLERALSDTDAKVLIIDNLTYLRSGTETAKDALPLMKSLKALKSKYNLSILALAHTPKRDLSKPITRNDLQGSKMLINFCDSSFAIGESFTDNSLRYIKQIKQRNCELVYDADNVAVCEIVKQFNFLQFEFVGYGAEKEYLRVPSDRDKNELEAKAKQLKAEGKSIRDIAQILNISKSQVDRLIKK
jgi:predicted DNA binding protein